jgi:hypothetical protein
MTPENAELLALNSLSWLAGEPEDLQRFLNLSGLDPASLRQAAGSSGLNGAILDFLLADEALLLRFCDSTGSDPKDIYLARHALEGGRCDLA